MGLNKTEIISTKRIISLKQTSLDECPSTSGAAQEVRALTIATMFRNRDILALLGLLVLVRTAWNSGGESLKAAVDLAFFFSRERVMVVSPMDVDGDGTEEALALMKSIPQEPSFTLEILDLKPLHGFRKAYLEPFRPKVIFASDGTVWNC